MKIAVSQLRRIIAEEVRRVVAEGDVSAELYASAGDWVEDNYDDILAKLQADPKLTAAILAAAGINESYVGGLARGVADYYTGGALANKTTALLPQAGLAGGYLAAEIMAIVKDPSLIPWTELRDLQLADKITMDGSAAKAMIVGALIAHLADVAMYAKKHADAEARTPRRARR
jgi:hypothetical protein